MLQNFIEFVISIENELLLAFLAGALVAFATFLGSLFALIHRKAPEFAIELSLSFSAGIMLVAGFLSLIMPSIEMKDFKTASIGILLGVLIIHLLDRFSPHEHIIKGYEGPEEFRRRIKVIWLILIAVVIHNIPEGLAVGTLLVYDVEQGLTTAFAIAIQDVPEGAIVALPLAVLGIGKFRAIFYGVLTGISEMVMVLLGALFFTLFSSLLSYGLSFAGGAMLYIVVKEMIPEIYKKEEDNLLASVGFLSGFYLMLFLETI
ncbi:MAG: ZIP family metal transporter [Archaeoglobaceae archaeon]|nr:ZIP family metal transporter [Archaeoglobaceae archaeon]MDW8117690.1 ZIP family metal transporter [Archaeoglobaceae archaeon]